MKVILLHNVKKIGSAGDVVDVADGYANGFLLPKKLAQVATKEALNSLKKNTEQEEAKLVSQKRGEKSLFDSIDGTEYLHYAQANDKGGLFSAIHAKDVSAIMQSTSATIFDAEHIDLREEIKEVGTYTIPISVGDNSGSITLIVEKK